METKRCKDCGVAKAPSEFYASSRSRACKPCYGIRNAEYVARKAAGGPVRPYRVPHVRPETKRCRRCGIEQPSGEFGVSSFTIDALDSRCKACRRLAHVDKRTRASELDRTRSPAYLDALYRRSYGIRFEDYERMFAAQNGVCAICEEPETARHPRTGGVKRLSIDHDHSKPRGRDSVRALLCHSCNAALGGAQDDPTLLRKMASYIESFQKT